MSPCPISKKKPGVPELRFKDQAKDVRLSFSKRAFHLGFDHHLQQSVTLLFSFIALMLHSCTKVHSK